ncbi:hypothetical protein [Algoriphagus namhaensis]
MKKSFLFLAFLLPFFGCAENQSPLCLEYTFGEEFDIQINQTTSLCDEPVSITFLEVINDSRCPQGVDCIWAGFVQVKLELDLNGQIYPVELSSDEPYSGIPSVVALQGYSVRLVDLTPYPAINVRIDGNQRRVILSIDKLES